MSTEYEKNINIFRVSEKKEIFVSVKSSLLVIRLNLYCTLYELVQKLAVPWERHFNVYCSLNKLAPEVEF